MQSLHTVAQQQKSVTPFPVFGSLHSDTITQVELGLLASLRDRLSKVEADVVTAEANIRARLEAGASVQPGEFAASLHASERRNVSWKGIVVRLADRLKLDGEAYCNRVLAATKPSVSIKLEISRSQTNALLGTL